MSLLVVRLVDESGETLATLRLPAELRDGTAANAGEEAVKDFVASRQPSTHVAPFRYAVDKQEIGPDRKVSAMVKDGEIMTIFIRTETRPPAGQHVPVPTPASALGTPALSAMPAGEVVVSFPRPMTPVTPHCSTSAASYEGARSVSSTPASSAYSPVQRSYAGAQQYRAFYLRTFIAGRDDVFECGLRQRIEDALKELDDAERVSYMTTWVAQDHTVGVRVCVQGAWSLTDTSTLTETRKVFQALGAPVHDPDVRYLRDDFSHRAPRHYAEIGIPLNGEVSSGKTNVFFSIGNSSAKC